MVDTFLVGIVPVPPSKFPLGAEFGPREPALCTSPGPCAGPRPQPGLPACLSLPVSSPCGVVVLQNMPPMSPEKPALCAGCGGKISDRYYLLAVDKQWHLRCLKCCECKLALESELTCFAKDGSIYCKEDYYRYSNQSPWVQKHSPAKGIMNRNALFSAWAFKGSFSQSAIP